ncbi:hypothetical protein BDZ85DRAFT_251167 [Elsinoe ampelina]|uniref:DUF7726 domain-containing protein n=1 Tax=Elsinoe ampelina TaxID=302913 RepID=A0A6A6G6K1_9PEZI|nr:hypothetical protein BDZ85DRAFT_251167 [Elsinoe ampelina]
MAPLTPKDANAPPTRHDSALQASSKGKKRSHAEVESAGPTSTSPTPNQAKKSKKEELEEKEKSLDVSDIHLDGEDSESVPIYDTCQDIRNKINAELRKGTTQAELARQFSSMYPDARPVQGTQIKTFLGRKGPYGGAESVVYYGAYVFFEKLRLKQGKPESKKRLEVVAAHPGGMSRRDITRRGIWCRTGDRPYLDSVGKIHVQRR